LSKLSADEAKIIHDAWGDVVGWARQYSADELAQARSINEQNGVTYHDPSPAEINAMRDKMVGVQAKIVADGGMDGDFVSRVAKTLNSQ